MNQLRLTISLAVALACSFFASPARAQSQYPAATPTRASAPETNSLDSTFQKPSVEELRQKLTPVQFAVTQYAATEPAFQNEFWNNHRPGLYVDIVSGKPLFSSLDKFDSGCGWPSFTRPVENEEVLERTDHSLWVERIEVRSKTADTHLGHVFTDGPAPTGLRYCINSASLRFIPLNLMEKEGYAAFLQPFIKAGLYKPAPKSAAPAQPK